MKWHEYVMRIMSIARIGQKYTHDDYARENYEELEKLSLDMLNQVSVEPYEKNIFERDIYPTPNVSVRVMIKQDNQLLMVKEKQDGGWAVPGGWCEVYLSLSENAKKEVKEETGLDVEMTQVLAIMQREKYKDYKSIVSEYVVYVAAHILGGEIQGNHEVTDVGFFNFEQLPELSKKNTITELTRAYNVLLGNKPVQFD